MATERELKTQQEQYLYDMLRLKYADEAERELLFNLFLERALSGMTAEEVDAVKERVARSKAIR
jgi:hypothetical protein